MSKNENTRDYIEKYVSGGPNDPCEINREMKNIVNYSIIIYYEYKLYNM